MGVLEIRQNNDDLPDGFVREDGRVVYFWYTRTGSIIKWSILLGITLLVSAYLLGGYLHAKRRLKKGLLPLRYHRFLISRRELAQVDPSYAFPDRPVYSHYRADYYNMHPVPPPVYDPNAARPPMYEPPNGATKVDPAQRA